MKKERKICVVTSTRAEYGILKQIIIGINKDPELCLQLIITGTHLSEKFGYTIKEIKEDQLPIEKKIDILLASDTPIGISKTMGLALISFSEALQELNPDLLLLVGDRFEIFSISAAAVVANIPIAHIHGGESTIGAMDEAFRHSITKMASIHFTATERYRQRVIQLGEHPSSVFNVGAPGLDGLSAVSYLDKEKLEDELNFKISSPTALVTFHPVTKEKGSECIQAMELIKALDTIDNLKIIFTQPNADEGGRKITSLLKEYANQNPSKTIFHASLGQTRYFSCLKYVDLVIGNSSSGIIEVPSFHIPTINIGSRQKGRVMGSSIIETAPSKESIIKGIQKALSEEFTSKVEKSKNPYGGPGASKKIIDIIKSYDLRNILKKEFYDL